MPAKGPGCLCITSHCLRAERRTPRWAVTWATQGSLPVMVSLLQGQEGFRVTQQQTGTECWKAEAGVTCWGSGWLLEAGKGSRVPLGSLRERALQMPRLQPGEMDSALPNSRPVFLRLGFWKPPCVVPLLQQYAPAP